MKSERIDQLLAEIETIQKSRRTNWPSPDAPTDESLESSHSKRIQECREEINQLQES